MVISGVVLIGLYSLLTGPSDDSTANQIAPVATSTNTGVVVNTGSSTSSRTGTYTAASDYGTPHGVNSITVRVTLQNGTITSVTTTHSLNDRESRQYVNQFDNSIQSAVVGQPISSASVNRLGGASLTSAAFDNAIQQIAQQAG